MDEAIKVGYNKERVKEMSVDEKLDLLIEIAFSNNTEIVTHRRLLLGNGKEGICDTLRVQGKSINIIWTIIVLIIGGFIGLALKG